MKLSKASLLSIVILAIILTFIIVSGHSIFVILAYAITFLILTSILIFIEKKTGK